MNDGERALELGESNFTGVLDVFELDAACAEFLARFGGDVTFGGIDAAFQPASFALERLQALDGTAHLVDQALFLERIEVDVADRERNFHAGARDLPLGVNPRA